jgi:hypothetical protein
MIAVRKSVLVVAQQIELRARIVRVLSLERKDGDAHVFFAPSSLRAGGFWSRASQGRIVGYRIGEDQSGGNGTISQPVFSPMSESGPEGGKTQREYLFRFASDCVAKVF